MSLSKLLYTINIAITYSILSSKLNIPVANKPIYNIKSDFKTSIYCNPIENIKYDEALKEIEDDHDDENLVNSYINYLNSLNSNNFKYSNNSNTNYDNEFNNSVQNDELQLESEQKIKLSDVLNECSNTYIFNDGNDTFNFTKSMQEHFHDNQKLFVCVTRAKFIDFYNTSLYHRLVILELQIKVANTNNLVGLETIDAFYTFTSNLYACRAYFKILHDKYVQSHNFIETNAALLCKEIQKKIDTYPIDSYSLEAKMALLYTKFANFYVRLQNHYFPSFQDLNQKLSKLLKFNSNYEAQSDLEYISPKSIELYHNDQSVNENNDTNNGKKIRLPKKAVTNLKNWLLEHFSFPYPTDEEKEALAKDNNITFLQVSYWFVNARVRMWRPALTKLKDKN